MFIGGERRAAIDGSTARGEILQRFAELVDELADVGRMEAKCPLSRPVARWC